MNKISQNVVLLLFALTLTACGNREAMLEEEAVPLVTQILQRDVDLGYECKFIKINEELDDGFYSATATLNTGEEIAITIEDRDDEILVIVPFE